MKSFLLHSLSLLFAHGQIILDTENFMLFPSDIEAYIIILN